MSTTVSKRLLLRLPIIFFKGSYNYNSSDKAPCKGSDKGFVFKRSIGFWGLQGSMHLCSIHLSRKRFPI